MKKKFLKSLTIILYVTTLSTLPKYCDVHKSLDFCWIYNTIDPLGVGQGFE